MWTSLAFAASLLTFVPGEAEAVKFANIRFTYCPFGMERTDTKFLPGDVVFLAYDIENLAIEKTTTKVIYRMELELVDAKGERIFKDKPRDIEEQNTLLSFTQPGIANVLVGKDQAPGKYTVKVTVTDRIEKKSATFKRDFEVVKEGLGIIRVQAPVAMFVGPTFDLNFTVIGFGKEKKMPSFDVEVNILNDKGEAMLRKPKLNRVPEDLAEEIRPEEVSEIPFRFNFALNRVGRYTVAVTVKDKTTKKTAKLDYKISILDIKKYESGK